MLSLYFSRTQVSLILSFIHAKTRKWYTYYLSALLLGTALLLASIKVYILFASPPAPCLIFGPPPPLPSQIILFIKQGGGGGYFFVHMQISITKAF
jgi:hypothetical protein